MADTIGFYERYERLKDGDNDRHKLVEDLLEEVGMLSKKLSDTEMKLEREKETSNLYHQRCKESDVELKNKQKEMNCNGFVSVLIDGDCMNFLDNLVKETEEGGREAAQLLRKSVSAYLRSEIPELQHDLEIVVRVYGNLRGLSKTYLDANIIDQREEFERFVRGFNMVHPLCDFVDAGNGKECSDNKIREVFKLHIGDLHCKHHFFGGSADNGYARMLGLYAGNDSTSKRITMLEGPPFAQELSLMADKFHKTSFSEVFRDSKIQPRQVLISAEALKSKSPNPPSYASTVVSRPAYQAVPKPISTRETNFTHRSENTILRNSKGQRVDPPLAKPFAGMINAVKARKFCNSYHLVGVCSFSYCKHEHGDELDPKQLAALRYLARMNPCSRGLYCEDEECFAGHKCVHSGCEAVNCRFPYEMHDVDTRISKT